MAVTSKMLTSSHLLVVIICIAFCSTSCAGVDDDQQPVVEISTATFRGKRIEVNPHQLPDFQGSVAAFTGIPYAEPPVGDFRFKRPVPKVIEGDFDATRASVACPQVIVSAFDLGLVELSEDCLFLDVYVPEPQPTSAAVMVWIHGGGFQSGAGSFPKILPIPLAAMNDVIVVTLNYRLNAFGFLASGDDEIPANLGLLDQRQVLLWIQDNIAAFGGDPNQVTIFGESAGSLSVSLHIISPMSAGLFTGAIMESGGISDWLTTTMDDASQTAFSFGSALNCSDTTTKELATCLRQKSADDFINFFLEDPARMAQLLFRPVTDGQFIPRNPMEMSAEGEFNHVDVMIGCQDNEGHLFLIPMLSGTEGTDKATWDKTTMQTVMTMNMAISNGGIDQLVLDTATYVYASAEELSNPDTNYADAGATFSGDYVFLCPTFSSAEQLSAGGNSVYTYLMTHVPSGSVWGDGYDWLKATHAEDIPYVFGSPFMVAADSVEDSFLSGRFNDEEVQMSLQIMKYWSNFAKTGNPNLSSKEEHQEIDSRYPVWPMFTREEAGYKELSLSFEARFGHPFLKRCFFQLELLPELRANAAEMARLKSLLEATVHADSEKSCEDEESCPEE